MSEVRVLRLRTGEDLITQIRAAKPTEESGKVYLKDPQVMLLQPAGEGRLTFGFMPYFPFTQKGTEVGVARDYIVIDEAPNTELLNNYNKNFGSGLVIANTLPPGDGRGGVAGARIV